MSAYVVILEPSQHLEWLVCVPHHPTDVDVAVAGCSKDLVVIDGRVWVKLHIVQSFACFPSSVYCTRHRMGTIPSFMPCRLTQHTSAGKASSPGMAGIRSRPAMSRCELPNGHPAGWDRCRVDAQLSAPGAGVPNKENAKIGSSACRWRSQRRSALSGRRARLCNHASEYRSRTAAENRRFGGVRFHRDGLLGTFVSVVAVAHASRSADARCLWKEQDISPMDVRLWFSLVSVCMDLIVLGDSRLGHVCKQLDNEECQRRCWDRIDGPLLPRGLNRW